MKGRMLCLLSCLNDLKRLPILSLVVLGMIFSSGCSHSDTSAKPPLKKSAEFSFTESLNPTPLPHASTRYSDFVLHYRKVGDANYMDFPSSSVDPTSDRTVMVQFKISMPQPPVDQAYERYISYRLDGNWVNDGPPTTVKLIRSTAGSNLAMKAKTSSFSPRLPCAFRS